MQTNPYESPTTPASSDTKAPVSQPKSLVGRLFWIAVGVTGLGFSLTFVGAFMGAPESRLNFMVGMYLFLAGLLLFVVGLFATSIIGGILIFFRVNRADPPGLSTPLDPKLKERPTLMTVVSLTVLALLMFVLVVLWLLLGA